jgi:hypothetical protein
MQRRSSDQHAALGRYFPMARSSRPGGIAPSTRRWLLRHLLLVSRQARRCAAGGIRDR